MLKGYLKKSYDFFGHLFYFYFVKIDVVRKMNFKKNAGIVLIILGIILTFGYILFTKGYSLGKASLNFFSESGISDITKSIAVFGLIIVGCLAANRCNVATKISFMSNGEAVLLQDMIDKIFPNLLSLLIIMLFYWLMKVKKVKMQNLFYVTMIAVIALSLLGIV